MKPMFALLLLALSGPLFSQAPAIPVPQASASKESFVLEPTGLASGAQAATLRMIANTPAGFAASSSKPPEIRFGDGATLVVGSFRLLNTNEAECRVSIDADAMGVIDVSLIFYSVNGTSVLSTQRATLGVLGPTKIANIDVSVESVSLVRVNVNDAQAAGVIVLTGIVNGAVQLNSPTGARFSKIPVALTSKGSILTPALAEGNSQFNFSVGNGAGESNVVRITEISFDTSVFSISGGTLGALSCELRGAALGGQSTLVTNACTAQTTLAGSNDNTDAPVAGTNPTGSSSSSTGTTTPTPATGTTTTGTPSSGGTGRSRESTDPARAPAARTPAVRPSTSQPSGGSSGRSSSADNAPPAPVRQPVVDNPPPVRSEAPANPGAPRAVPTAGGDSSSKGTGSARWVPTEAKEAGDSPAATGTEAKPELVTTPGLYFCDKDFKPLDIVVLSGLVSDRASARVWIVVKLAKDKNPEAVETIDVTLRVSGTVRTLKLTETGKSTGEYRCDKAGVLLVSDENPESNIAKEKATPAKARPSGFGR